jgi:hypothetical protein
MSKVVIAGDASGTGTFTISAPNGNTDRTLVLPDEAGTVLTSASTANFPAGSVIQVVSTVDTSFPVSTATTFTEISSNWRLTITPKTATSKLLLSAQFCENRSSGANPTVHQARFYDVTNSTNVFIGDASGSRNQSTIAWRGSHADTNDVDEHMMYAVIAASSTVARTYTISFRSEAAATVNFNRSAGDSSLYGWTAPFIFTIMEIAA